MKIVEIKGIEQDKQVTKNNLTEDDKKAVEKVEKEHFGFLLGMWGVFLFYRFFVWLIRYSSPFGDIFSAGIYWFGLFAFVPLYFFYSLQLFEPVKDKVGFIEGTDQKISVGLYVFALSFDRLAFSLFVAFGARWLILRVIADVVNFIGYYNSGYH
ncbi:MAG: hypothetical protein FWG63_02235 [Defluviitaleaceae bacterium]|nr:hypothetical protein [Defluviitaleaceae bacterium]